ncbi:MAG: DUF202 domain-containing protein [Mycobacteriaceae bacterium]|nr:DUF202 domain-containing protein [Mycobacteriaceae bacterium]
MTGADADTGLARERTALSWRRTAIAAMANGALLSKVTVAGGTGWKPTGLVPLCGVVTLLLVAAAAFLRGRALQHGRHDGAQPLIAAVSAAVAAVGLAVVVMAATHAV